MNLSTRQVTPSDIDRCFEIESSAYPLEEAATREKIKVRAEQYPEGFIVLESDHNIIGFINSGCTDEVVMSDENFKELIGHSSTAANVVIMSVVIDPAFQGLGYSSQLMNAFIKSVVDLEKRAIHLMCKDQYVKLYEKFGFKYSKVSESSHGGEKWHEMLLEILK